MSAYDSARYYDLLERLSKGETLSLAEQAKFNRLDAVARREWENAPQPWLYGGDMADMF